MKKPLPRILHGPLADWPYVLAAGTAPEAVGFADDEPVATALCRTVSVGVMGLSLLTRAEWGAVRVVPYRTHLALELVMGAAALAAPWLFGFAHHRGARNTFLALGITALVVPGLLSEPEEMPPAAVAAGPENPYARPEGVDEPARREEL